MGQREATRPIGPLMSLGRHDYPTPTVKSAFASCVLGACALVILAQACGSDDDKQKSNRPYPSANGGNGGDGAAGESSTGTSGSGGPGSTAGESGAPSVAMAGSSGEAGAGTQPQGGNAGEGAQGNAGSQGGTGEAGTGSVGGAGEGGAGGAGEGATCELASACTGDLSSVGTGDFSIAFTLTTTTTARSGLISQRAVCMHSKFWDVRLGTIANQSALSIELDDQSHYTAFTAPATLNDGEPHVVRVCRKAGQVYAFADGVLVADAASETNLNALPALATSTTTCNALDGTVDLVGSVTDVCVGSL
jgi:hypothetical protein